MPATPPRYLSQEEKVAIPRRTFLAAAAGALFSRAVGAQPASIYRIGWISLDTARSGTHIFEGFREGMRDVGYVEGRNIAFDVRWAESSFEQLEKMAVEMVRSNPNLIVTQGGPAFYPVLRAGASIPIVFGFSGDPIEGRLVPSLTRPGVNRTGIRYQSLDVVAKRMELLKEVMPHLKKIALLANPEHPGEQAEVRASEAAAKAQGLTLEYFPVRSASELEDVLDFIPGTGSRAMIVSADAFTMRYCERLAQFSAKTRIPAVSAWAEFAERGNLMAYGPILRDAYRQLAAYVDRILKGAKAGDLPVLRPTSVELVVNSKAASAAGIEIPQAVMLRANKVIK